MTRRKRPRLTGDTRFDAAVKRDVEALDSNKAAPDSRPETQERRCKR